MPGKLSIVATPIGHLDDLSPRARQALERADIIACEDTRRTGRLLSQLAITRNSASGEARTRLISMHDHNERQRLPQLLAALAAGQHVTVVSDAGTPLLSDPGYPLLRDAAAQGIKIEAVPGPSAILAALMTAALPPYPFSFAGFPPPKRGKRRQFFQHYGALGHTLVIFESPHRLVRCLEDAAAELGDRPAALCRELTKLHEEVVRGDLPALAAEFASRPTIKGECVLVIGPAAKKSSSRQTSTHESAPG